MKLHHNPASPYVRKVIVTAHETGLIDRLQLAPIKMTPVNPHDGLNADNPLGKIPALVLEDGTTLFDSRVICEYLDSLHRGPRLFPADGEARWRALRRQALADGILDAAVGTRYELFLRPSEKHWQDWIDSQKDKFRRALDVLEGETETLGDAIDIGVVATGCALGYLDFRYADEGWREGRTRLAVWYEGFAERASMQASLPADLV